MRRRQIFAAQTNAMELAMKDAQRESDRKVADIMLNDNLCAECGRKFKTAHGLKIHNARTHK